MVITMGHVIKAVIAIGLGGGGYIYNDVLNNTAEIAKHSTENAVTGQSLKYIMQGQDDIKEMLYTQQAENEKQQIAIAVLISQGQQKSKGE